MNLRRKRPFLVALRWALRTRRNRRWVAQRLYWCAGKLAKIKTRRRTYRLDPVALDAGEIRDDGTVRWRWLPCRASMKVLGLSMQLDWSCWDHWALNHEGHETVTCTECGYEMCVEYPDGDEEDADSPIDVDGIEIQEQS